MSTPPYLVKGADPILREDAVAKLVAELLAGDDRTLAIAELTVPGKMSPGGDADASGDADGGSGAEGRGGVVAAILNAALSPPFMTSRRIVVVREVEHLTSVDAEPLAAYIADPLDTTVLVFVTGGGRLPASLTKAWKGVVVERAPEAEQTSDVLAVALRGTGLALTPDASALVNAHLGDDAGRVPQLVELLVAAYGPGATLGAGDVEPYLGEAGSVPAYQLTNAIESGDVAGALETLARMLNATGPRQPKPMHALQVMALLHNHYRRLLRLDDTAIHGEADAIEALGGRVKPYPARKALEHARALGTDGLRRAVDYLHEADVGLKGATGMPEQAVIEVLVARLAGLSNRARGRRGRAGARR